MNRAILQCAAGRNDYPLGRQSATTTREWVPGNHAGRKCIFTVNYSENGEVIYTRLECGVIDGNVSNHDLICVKKEKDVCSPPR